MSNRLQTIGIIGLILAIIILIVLFMFIKIAFWIGLVVVLILGGLWVYMYFFKDPIGASAEAEQAEAEAETKAMTDVGAIPDMEARADMETTADVEEDDIKEDFVAQNLNKPAVDVLYAATVKDLAAIKQLDDLKKGYLKLNDISIQRKIHFRDPTMNTNGTQNNNYDPYYLEKVTNGKNKSSLRLTINDEPDEAFEIWGNSCKTSGCQGSGTSQHKFQADGNVWHNANVHAKGDLVFSGSNGWVFHTPDDHRKSMFIAPKGQNGWDFNKAITYHNNGYMNVKGGITVQGGTSTHNPQKYETHFSHAGNGKNYIRGDTEITGNTNNIGNITVGSNLIVGSNISVRSNISLGGNISVGSNLYVKKNLYMASNSILYNQGRQHIYGGEKLFVLNKGGVHVSKAWGGNGNLIVDGQLCIGNTCLTEADLKLIKK